MPRAGPIARAQKHDITHAVSSVPGSAVPPNWRSDAGLSLFAGPATPARSRVRADARICGSDAHSIQFWEALSTHLDEQNAELQSLVAERDSAAKQQRFSDAAHLSQKIQEIRSTDSLAELRADQACAVAQQDFRRAAALQAHLGPALGALPGWWQTSTHKTDIRGHVIYVSEAFGKLVGRVFSATDVTRIFGCTPDNHLGVNPSPQLMSQLGTVVFEVVLCPGSGSGVPQQCCM